MDIEKEHSSLEPSIVPESDQGTDIGVGETTDMDIRPDISASDKDSL